MSAAKTTGESGEPCLTPLVCSTNVKLSPARLQQRCPESRFPRLTSYNKCKKQTRNLMKDFASLKKKVSVARLSHLGEHIR